MIKKPEVIHTSLPISQRESSKRGKGFGGWLGSCFWLAGLTILFLILLIALLAFLSIRIGRFVTTEKKEAGEVQETLFKEPPVRRNFSGGIEIFSPIHQSVLENNPMRLRGRAKTGFILISLNQGEERIIPTKQGDTFETDIELRDGVNQLTLLMFTTERQLYEKNLVYGLNPAGSEQKQIALVGEVMDIFAKDQAFEIATQSQRHRIITNPQTSFAYQEGMTGLDYTFRVGVIADQAEGSVLAHNVRVDSFSYPLQGRVLAVEAGEIMMEREGITGQKTTIVLNQKTVFRRWSGLQDIFPSSSQDIKVDDTIQVQGYLIPKENRSRFYAERIILLKN